MGSRVPRRTYTFGLITAGYSTWWQRRINRPSIYPSWFFQGNSEFVSEKLTAYELGYRTWPTERLSLDVALFYNNYDDLHALERRNDLIIPGDGYLLVPDLFVNAVRSQTYGFEVATNWQAMDWWRLQLAYSYLRMKFQNKPGYSELIPVFQEGSQPHHQISLRSSFISATIWNSICGYIMWMRYRADYRHIGAYGVC